MAEQTGKHPSFKRSVQAVDPLAHCDCVLSDGTRVGPKEYVIYDGGGNAVGTGRQPKQAWKRAWLKMKETPNV